MHDQCFGTPASATTLLLRGQARIHDQCFSTPASVSTLLLRGQARLCSVSYCTFEYISYRVSFILYLRSKQANVYTCVSE